VECSVGRPPPSHSLPPVHPPPPPPRSDILIRELEKLGIKTKAAANTIRHERKFAEVASARNKRKRTFIRDVVSNTHLVGTAAGDELERARQAIAAERGGVGK
jgi:hypothetical protein